MKEKNKSCLHVQCEVHGSFSQLLEPLEMRNWALGVVPATLGPSEHLRFHPCGNIPQGKSTLHSTSRSCANLGPDWDVSLQRNFESHFFNFLKIHLFLFSLSQPCLWASLAQPVLGLLPGQTPREIFLPQDTWDAQLCRVQRSGGVTMPGNLQKTCGYGPRGHSLMLVLSWIWGF